MLPQLRHMSDRIAPSSGSGSSVYGGQHSDSDANSTSQLSALMLKIEKSDVDSMQECDTTQEDLEGYEHQNSAYVDTSTNMDDSQDGLDSTVLQPSLPQAESIPPMSSLGVVMDSTLDSSGLSSLQAVAMETSREIIHASSVTADSISAGTSGGESQSARLASLLSDEASGASAPATQPQSVRKSRRLELVAQESKVSLKKRNYKSKQYDPAMLWCEDCMDAFSDQCPAHRLTAVPDKIVLSRAWASCPNQVQICRLHEAQVEPGDSAMGVFAKRQIPKFTQFGPLLGVLVDSLDKVTRQFFPLMVSFCSFCCVFDLGSLNLNLPREYFETADENECNWMMFIRPAKTFAEQNLVAYQHRRNVFFSSTRTIEPKQELKVWYAAPYAEQMGVKTLELTEDDIQDEADGRFACSECSRRFKSWAALQRHLATTHEDEEDEDQDLLAEQEVGRDKMAALAEFAAAEADGDADFLPRSEEGRDRQLSSGSVKARSRGRGASLRGRLRHGRGRTVGYMSLFCVSNYSDVAGGICVLNLPHHLPNPRQPLGKDGRPFCCGRCTKSFSSAEKLSRHQMVHGDESQKPLKCTVCSKRVMTNSAMACHMKTHGDRKYFDCPICGTDFATGAGLREHAQISHADQSGRFPCKECSKIFEDFVLLKKHVRSFHSNRVFQCPECSKMFPRVDKLRLHMLRHTNHREFMCETCGRQFKRKDKLREHMKRLHAGRDKGDNLVLTGSAAVEEQPGVIAAPKFTPKVMPSEYHRFIYKCHTCLIGFKRRGMLVNHLAKRHPEIRPEHVPELNLPILKTQKDFYCQYCDKIYKSASKRKMHIQKMHPGCAVPPSARKKLPHTLAEADGGAAGGGVDGVLAVGPVGAGFNATSFSHTVSSITTMPHGCKFCHKQYASKAKLIQHQRKQHPEIAEPRNSSRRKIKKVDPDMLQISVSGDERFEPVLPITVVNQGGDATSLQATDLLNLAMSELNYSGAGGVASLSSLISSLGGVGSNTVGSAGAGGAMVHIQSSSGQLQPATIDLSQLSQLNQALQTFTVTGGHQGPPLSPSQQHHHHHQPQQQHHIQLQQQQHQQQQIQIQQHQLQQQQQQQQQVTVVTPTGSQTINLTAGGQFIARAWPGSFTTQSFR
ncbi:hypothetical protein EGW08_014665 [Elysia chlorotica]|uniref:PR domain zinc finger protein 10 n=1 Tax=Elysia chlorotica TaxID=188477 RepID=A0A433T7I9_ELYCH|nr:hypothetical protein EGW08_014665 [Elysia chlorotica]